MRTLCRLSPHSRGSTALWIRVQAVNPNPPPLPLPIPTSEDFVNTLTNRASKANDENWVRVNIWPLLISAPAAAVVSEKSLAPWDSSRGRAWYWQGSSDELQAGSAVLGTNRLIAPFPLGSLPAAVRSTRTARGGAAEEAGHVPCFSQP